MRQIDRSWASLQAGRGSAAMGVGLIRRALPACRYAANCITHPGGDWWGGVNSSEDADRLLTAITSRGDDGDDDVPVPVRQLWRGRMGLSEAQQEDLMARLAKQQQ